MTQELIAGNVKAAMKESGAGSSDLWKVPIENLYVMPGFNVRSDGDEHAEHIAELVESIMANGYLASHPLAGYVAVIEGVNKIAVTDGHCRLEAVKIAISRGAEITHLPVVASPKGTNMEDLIVGLVINNSGKPLTQFEVGTVCKRLAAFGWDEKEIGRRLGMSAQRVGDLLGLAGAPATVRRLVADGKVSATQAIDTIKRHGAEAGDKLKAGVEKAAAAGKGKATRKHIEGKPTTRAVVKALIEWAEVESALVGDYTALKKIVKMARESL